MPPHTSYRYWFKPISRDHGESGRHRDALKRVKMSWKGMLRVWLLQTSPQANLRGMPIWHFSGMFFLLCRKEHPLHVPSKIYLYAQTCRATRCCQSSHRQCAKYKKTRWHQPAITPNKEATRSFNLCPVLTDGGQRWPGWGATLRPLLRGSLLSGRAH